MTAARAVVLDASTLVRAAVQPSTRAWEWLEAIESGEVEGHTPELAYAEVGNSLAKYVRAGRITAHDAVGAVEAVAALPLQAHPLRSLAPAAFALALETGLSLYDCCYAVLAESLGARLVTADRRLAALIHDAELLD